MTVDFLEEEMNILNLNGLSVQDVTDNVNYLRMTGLDDNTIRAQYDELLSELEPFVKIDFDDPQKIQEWNAKGAITPFEFGQMKAVKYNSTYNNIDENANLSSFEQKLKNSDYNNTVEERIAKQKQEKEERNKRVNEGTASFLDRAGAALDRWGNAALQEQINGNQPVLPRTPIEKTKPKEGKITFAEGLESSFESMSWLPYVGGYISGADTKKEREIREHILNGEPIRQDELDFLNMRLEEQKEKNVRGYTIGGQIAENFLPSVVRFGSEIYSGGFVLKSLGLEASIAANAATKTKILGHTGNMLKAGAVNTLLPTTYNDTFETYQNRMSENEMTLTKDGEVWFQESQEKPATAFLKSVGSTFIMFAAEHSGALISMPVKTVEKGAKKFITPVTKYLMENQKVSDFVNKIVPVLSKKYEEMNNLPVVGKSVDWLKERVKYDGFIEELGEEVVEDILALTIGINNEERSLENYAKAVFKSSDEWAVLAGSVILQGTVLSLTSNMLGSALENNGASDEEILEVLNSLSEEEKKNIFEQLIASSEVELGEVRTEEEKRIEEQSNQVKDNVFNLLVEKGFSEEDAKLYSEFFKYRSKMVAKKWGDVNAVDWFSNLGVDVISHKQETNADSSPVSGNGVSYNQSAMKRSQFDNFTDFYNDTLTKDKNTKDKRQFNFKTSDNLFLRVPHDTLLHEQKKHKLTVDEWNDLLNNIDNIQSAIESRQKPRYSGKPVLLKVKSGNNIFGVVVELFDKNNPIISTAFIDTEKNIDNWIKNEAISYGTKTTFTNIRLNNIISDLKPNFKPFNPNSQAENVGLKPNLQSKSQTYNQGNVPKYIDEEYTVKATNRHYEGGYTSPAVNKLLDRLFNGEQVERDSLDERMQKVYDDYQKGVYKRVEGTPEHKAIRQVLNPDWKPQYGVSEKSKDEIIEDYEEKTSTEKVGKGYSGYSMSNNAVEAYKKGSMPISKWNKKNIIEKIKEIADYYSIPVYIEYFNKLKVDELKNFLKKDGYHHTSKMYNSTDFYKVDIEKILDEANLIDNTNTFYQSAYHGTPHRFDEFSLDNIGSGEGAQVHGWGLYFAENKDVSENYRKSLSGDDFNNEQYFYEEQPIKDRNKKAILASIVENGKEKVVKVREKSLDKYKYDNSEYEKKKEELEYIKNLDESKIGKKTNKGQLFEVDIPENDVLLDENKTYSEQPQKVKNALFVLNRETKGALNNELNKFEKSLGTKITGREIYKAIGAILLNNENVNYSEHFNSISYADKLASEKLNKLGIKGITYDGAQDGRCYVIFDDKAISVLQTFYQEGKKLTNLQRKDGKTVNVEYYDNSDIQDVKPLNIRKLKFDKKDEKSIKNKDIKQSIFNGKKSLSITNSQSNIEASLPIGNIDEMVNNIFKNIKNDNKYIGLKKEIISNVETIFQNAIPVLKHNELKNENLYDKQVIHRFALPVKIGGNNFLTMITVKERTDFKESKIDEFTIYDLNSKTINKKMTDSKSQDEKTSLSRNQSSVISMNDITDFVNSNLDKYKVTLNQESNNQPNFTQNIFGENKVDINSKEEYDNFVDNFSSEETRASITFEVKPLQTPKAIIELFENADKSSFLHEIGHLFLQDIINASKTNEHAKRELEAINKMLGHTQGEYTRAEHEKFAKGFELYLMNGKAPNAGLKSAFDTFKSWLREVYNFVLASNGALSQDVYAVYDSLFKDYNPDDMEVVKSIVRNAVNTSNNSQDGFKSINSAQKRYKETAYDILAKALGKKKSYLKSILENKATKKNAKALEEIENKIANISDELSSSDGMLPEWKEFFADNNIGDNSETKSDYELVQKAYDVIVNKSYLDYDANYNPNEIDPALFEKYEKAYNYLLDIYRNGNEKQKDYAVAAMYDWLDSCLIGELYEEIFTEMFEQDFQELERIANLDKFGKAKEKISNAAKLLSYSDTKNFNKLVTETLKSLDFLTSKDKTIILSNLMQYKTTEEIRNNLDEIMDIAKILDSQNYFNRVETKIQKALEGTKNVKQGNKTVGKYTKEINDVFADLRRFNNMTQERAAQELETMNMFEGEETDSLSFEDKLRHKFLYYKATPNMYISSDFISDLYKDILTLKNYGYLKKEQDKFMRKVNIDTKIEKLLRVLDKKKKGGKLIKKYIQWFSNWESALNAIFNNDVKEEYSLLDKEAQVQVWQNKQKQDFLNEAIKIFGVNQYKFDNLIIDKLAEKYTFTEYGAKRTHKIEMNKMEIILAYVWSKNPNLKERLERQFTQQGLYDMFSNLDNEEIEFANLLQKTASKFYNEANKVYIQKYGIELPRVQNYFPSKTERTSVVDLLADFSFQSAASPSFIKNRVVSNMPTMKFSNPLTLLFSHIDKMGVFINMTETIDLYNKVFTDVDVKKTITELYGKETFESFATTLANSSYQKQAVKSDGLTKIFNTMVNNFVSSKIILKPSIMIKQLLSTVNYAENMPVTAWATGFLKAVANPKETIDFMMSDEYLKTRFSTGGQNEYLKQVIENSKFAKTRKFIDYCSLSVKLGDIGAIIFGGKPYIDYLMKVKGLTKEAAFKEFRLSTMRSQQASMASSLSNFQNNFNNPFIRGLFSFRNTPNQYFRKVADSIISYANGDTSKGQMAKTVFIYTFLNAFMYNTATSLSILALAINGGDDDDDLKKDIIKSLFDFNSQAVPILGDIWTYVLERIMGESRKGDVSIPAITDIFDAIQKLTAEDVTLEDWINELSAIADITTGLPVQTAVNMTGGAVDIAQGNVASGALRTIGYTKKRSQKTTGEED